MDVMVYCPSPDGKEDFVRDIDSWLRERGHHIWCTKFNWRKLTGGQCHARNGYLEGSHVGIRLKGTTHYDPKVLLLMKLTFG